MDTKHLSIEERVKIHGLRAAYVSDRKTNRKLLGIGKFQRRWEARLDRLDGLVKDLHL